MRFKAIISALVLLLVAATMAPAAGAASLPKLATQAAERDEELQVRPATISYTGDGTGYVGGRTTSPDHYDRGGIDWQSWEQDSAVGRGWVWINDCRPYCAAGHFHKARATVRASRPRNGLFTRLTIAYRWGGRDYHDHRVLERSGGYYYWGV